MWVEQDMSDLTVHLTSPISISLSSETGDQLSNFRILAEAQLQRYNWKHQ